MMGFGGFGGMAGFGGFGMLLGLLVWVALLALVVWAVASLFPGRREAGQETPLEILRRRYAQGEISAVEYEQARKALGA